MPEKGLPARPIALTHHLDLKFTTELAEKMRQISTPPHKQIEAVIRYG